jgi:YidC/Oxa1 family membrane protein insertase
MEDQGKRLLLAVGIIALLYIAWTLLFTPKAPAPPPGSPQQVQAPAAPAASTPGSGAATGVATGAPTGAPSSAPSTAAAAAAAAAPAEGTGSPADGAASPAGPAAAATPPSCTPEKPGEAATWNTNEWTATFSRCGGALASFQLKGKQYQISDDSRAPRQIDLVRTGEDPALYPLQLQVDVPQSGGVNPDAPRVGLIPPRAQWELVSQSDSQVVFRWISPDRGIEVLKTFKRLDPSVKYAFQLDFEVKNISDKKDDRRLVAPNLLMFGLQDPAASGSSMFHYAEPTWTVGCYVDGKLKTESVKDLRSGPRPGGAGDVRWAGLDHQYFLLAMAPIDRESTGLACAAAQATPNGVMQETLSYTTATTLDPHTGSVRQSVVVYGGPKVLEQLEAVSTATGKDTRLASAVDLGWFGFIARPMLFLLKFFYGWVKNWGVAIILLTVVVKLATLYWTQKSMRSMKAMSRLKPEMDRIRQQYANDKQRQNLEIMNLYKRHQISPLGGCLPMLLQMPIWFALYQTLRAAAELYRAPFAGWITDLTAPDPLHIIPIALTILSFVQAKIQPAAVDSQQQKMMQYMMPAMLGFFSLVFPSGLAVYMFTNSVLTMAHQFYMNRTDPSRPAVAPASAGAGSGAASGAASTSAGSRPPASTPPKKGGGRKRMAKA